VFIYEGILGQDLVGNLTLKPHHKGEVVG